MKKHIKIISQKNKWACVEIPRIGCTTIKHLAYYDHYEKEFENDEENIHSVLGYDENEIIKPFYFNDPDYFTFAIWRNPIARSISCWRSFTQQDPEIYGDRFGLNGCDFDAWIEFVEEELKKEEPDIHIRKQVDFYHYNDVDRIIPLLELNEFLFHEYQYVDLFNRATSIGIKPQHEITKEHRRKIFDLYQRDFAISLCDKFFGRV